MQNVSIDSLWEIGNQTQGKHPNFIVVFTIFYTENKLTQLASKLFLSTEDVLEYLDKNEITLPSSDTDNMALTYYYPELEESSVAEPNSVEMTHLYFFYIRDVYTEIINSINITSLYNADVVISKKVISPGDTGVSVNITPVVDRKLPVEEKLSLYSLPTLNSWQF